MSIDPSRCPPTSIGAWVYFIREMGDGPIKIGYAWNVAQRLKCSQVGNPRKLRLVGALFVPELEAVRRGVVPRNTKCLEKALHKKFSLSRIRGEWFGPTEELLAYIAALPSPTIGSQP